MKEIAREIECNNFWDQPRSPRSTGVTKGQKSKNFNIGQMTYQIEGNCTGNRLQPFLAPRKVTRGHQRSKIETIQHRSNDLPKCRKLAEGPVSQDQTGPKGQYMRIKLARRASTSGLNWPEGPVHQEQTGPKGQYIRSKLARRAST